MGHNDELLRLAWYAIGFGYSLFVGSLLIGCTQKSLYLNFQEGKSPEWRSIVTGLVERGLYTASILANFPAFVGIWLGVKTISHWEIFKSDYDSSPEKKRIIREGNARSIFNGYFVGTGLSIAYGSAGAYVTKLLIHHQCISAIVVMIALVGAHSFLNWYVRFKVINERNTKITLWSIPCPPKDEPKVELKIELKIEPAPTKRIKLIRRYVTRKMKQKRKNK